MAEQFAEHTVVTGVLGRIELPDATSEYSNAGNVRAHALLSPVDAVALKSQIVELAEITATALSAGVGIPLCSDD